MARFSMFNCPTWNDAAFRQLDTDARLLFIWSWTNPLSTICGLYQVSQRQMEIALSTDPDCLEERVALALEQLAAKPMVRYDEENEVIWVVNRAKHSNRSPKVAKAMQREVQDCPPSPLVDEFVARYGSMLNLRLREEE